MPSIPKVLITGHLGASGAESFAGRAPGLQAPRGTDCYELHLAFSSEKLRSEDHYL